MDAVLADLARHWPIYTAIPFIAALIGYVTKRVAIEMMFRPLEFRGIPPLLGWQGVVPRHGGRMAAIATDLLTKNLLDLREVFAKIDPDRITREIEQPMLQAIDQIARDTLADYPVWDRLPPIAKDLVVKQIQASSPQLVRDLTAELRDNIDEVLDVKYMTVQNLTKDKALLVKLIRETSRPEMAFIARCGIYFGFFLGLAQAVTWALTKEPWVLPIFGGCIGLLTDWLAIKLIFVPRKPIRILRRFSWQGKFQKRKAEVARQYGEVIAHDVLTVPNVVDAILHGPRADRLFAMVQRMVAKTVEEHSGPIRPMARMLGDKRMAEVEHAFAVKTVELLPETIKPAEGYLTEATDVARMVEERMLNLTPLEYEGLLRPAFRQDEWKLIVVGGVIGFLVGELQVVLMLH